mmetsp:Transcript_29581/g.81234  ORF Transcript_29581/g.81234 Transcript_29581/m.81234 type:complete len:352 (+) Transcript_29581:74-1129(+)
MPKDDDEPPSVSQQLFATFADAKPQSTHDLFTMIQRCIGVGTFGRVRVAEVSSVKDEHHQPVVIAIKIMKKTELVRLKQVEHVKNEVHILQAIDHPFIATLYHSFMDDRNLYLLQEFVPGGQLYRLIGHNQRLPNNSARFYAAQVVMAMQYLHGEHIIYRDLNPENVLLDEQGYVKLVDFGFAKRINLDDISAKTWTLCGTPEYLAPEIIQSKGHGRAVDWWALGILIYEMLAGFPPFYDENPFGIYQRILQNKLELPRHFETHARDLIRKLLTADLSKRLGSNEGGADVQKHKWFRGLSFPEMEAKQLKAPFIPDVQGEDDTEQFDEYPDSEGDPKALAPEQDQEYFDDF